MLGVPRSLASLPQHSDSESALRGAPFHEGVGSLLGTSFFGDLLLLARRQGQAGTQPNPSQPVMSQTANPAAHDRVVDEHIEGTRTEPTSLVFEPELLLRQSA